MQNYTGRDLGLHFKRFFKNEQIRLKKYLKQLGCTNIQMSMQFNYFYGFFTSKTGQMYYFSCSDIRFFGYDKITYRTVTNYSDFNGGSNNTTGVKPNDLRNLKLL